MKESKTREVTQSQRKLIKSIIKEVEKKMTDGIPRVSPFKKIYLEGVDDGWNNALEDVVKLLKQSI